MPEGAARLYRFGPFVLDVADRSLKRDGASLPLTPKTFDLLVALVENAGRLVEKDVLLRTVWPDVAVEEGNLTKGVFTLRQVFETGGEQGYIETVPKRGYRFTAPVSVAQEQPSPISSTPSSSAAAPDNSIAVMPFTDMSAARDQEYFCEGMSEEIINALDRVPHVRVASYTSSLRFRGKAIDTQTIGRDLSVGWLLEGSVRKAGNRVRITGQLIDATTGAHLWAERFGRSLEDVFDLQDQVTESVVGAIAPNLSRLKSSG